jgi:hypothetical protein
MSGITECAECKMCDTIITLHERILALENAALIKEGVALQPTTAQAQMPLSMERCIQLLMEKYKRPLSAQECTCMQETYLLIERHFGH